jgi:hypothetical protein
MTETDYNKVLGTAFVRLGEIAQQLEQLQTEATKLRQFAMATINMLPDEERDAFMRMMEAFEEDTKASDASLKQGCLRVLREFYPRWLTVAQVRDRLASSGFDFSKYTSNPLASVSTTLRRMKREDVQTAEVEGVAAYRLRHRPKLVVRKNSPMPNIPKKGDD